MIACDAFQSFYSFFTGDDSEKSEQIVVESNTNVEPTVEKNVNEKKGSKKRKRICGSNQRVSLRTRTSFKKKRSALLWFSRRRIFQQKDQSHNDNLQSSCSNTESPDNIDTIKRLEELYPKSTAMERRRFASGRNLKKSAAKMDYYMKWREQFNLDDDAFNSQKNVLVDDEESWNYVVSYTAKQMNPPVELKSPLPRIVRFGDGGYEPRTREGGRIAHILAAMIDLNMASQEFYSACVATYLDFKLDRNSLETIAVLIDVRAGTGWPNPPGVNLLPFIKSMAKTLSKTMPERLGICIVYPLPSPAKVIWVIVSGFLDPKHVEKIRIIWGTQASAESMAPVEEMKEYFNDETIDYIEQARVAEFKLIESDC